MPENKFLKNPEGYSNTEETLNPEQREDKIPEDLIQKASRVVLKAAERDRAGRFASMRNRRRIKKFTKKNEKKMREILEQKPALYRNETDSETKMDVDNKILNLFPSAFFDDPTRWIESQNILDRTDESYIERNHFYGDDEIMPRGNQINEYMESDTNAIDVSAVRIFTLTGPDGATRDILSIRMNDEKHEGEIELAQRAYELGIPTARVYGQIYDKGNTYSLFEALQGINLVACKKKCHGIEFEKIQKKKEEIKELIKEKGLDHKDFADRNIIILWDFKNDKALLDEKGDPQLRIIDWELVPEEKGGTSLHKKPTQNK